MNFENERFYRLYELEEKLNITRNTLYNWINDGILAKKIVCDKIINYSVRLKAERIGGEYRVLGAEINYFLAKISKK